MASKIGSSTKEVYACGDCGHVSPKWFGRCPECGGWGTVDDEAEAPDSDALRVVPLVECGVAPRRLSSGIDEVDRVLGGGFVEGEIVLLAGEPGVGKSTLVLQVLNGLMGAGHSCLLVTAEESVHQVGLRAARIGIDTAALKVAAGSNVQSIVAASKKARPDVLVVDSVQTVRDPNVEQSAGSVVQVRECAARLADFAKTSGTCVVLVGHVTKEGSVAGPKVLEHLVDAVVTLEGDSRGAMRCLRAMKNRFGSCDELGIFTMAASGLEAIGDPSAMLLEDRHPDAPGSVVFPSLEGGRALLVEVQALVTPSSLTQPRRVAVGVDPRRLSLVVATLMQCWDKNLGLSDVFVAAAGGLAVREPAADLALCVALVSARTTRRVDSRTIFIGEVGLAGEIRRVPGIERRLREAVRLGFTSALVPYSAREVSVDGIAVTPVRDVNQAVSTLS
jgi:DNA repair protein RadA/Sms